MGIFYKLLGLSSMVYFEAFFVRLHVVLPISSEGIRVISLEVIVPIVYLGSWALVALVIASRNLLDLHSSLLEAIGVSSLGPLIFQAHLRLA